MPIYEHKLKGKPEQYAALDDAIRTGMFIRNSCIRYWLDTPHIGRYDLYKYCKVLADNQDYVPWGTRDLKLGETRDLCNLEAILERKSGS